MDATTKTMIIVPSIAFPFPYPGQIFANIKLIQAYTNYFTNNNGFPPNITQYYLFILFYRYFQFVTKFPNTFKTNIYMLVFVTINMNSIESIHFSNTGYSGSLASSKNSLMSVLCGGTVYLLQVS